MKNHLIKKIHIKDFKCFDDFKAEGFARVNLICGKNNVGKTAFMEACYINCSSTNLKKFLDSLTAIKLMRENLNLLSNVDLLKSTERMRDLLQKYMEQSNNIFAKTNINKINFYIEEKRGVKSYCFLFYKKPLLKVNVNEFSFETEVAKNVNFIDNFGLSNNEIESGFSSVQKKDDEEYINKVLREFDSSIDSFKIIEGLPQCKTNEEYLQITEFGDGVRHMISILTTLYDSENGYLFIDEIDNGIHYTALDNVWEIILKLSEELNVQVFATTHSKECIESFNRVQIKLKNKDSSYFELAKEKDTKKIFMSALPPEQLEYELSHQGKFRGE